MLNLEKVNTAIFIPSHKVRMPYVWCALNWTAFEEIPIYILTPNIDDINLKTMVNYLNIHFNKVEAVYVPEGYHNAFFTAYQISEKNNYQKIIWHEDDIIFQGIIHEYMPYGVYPRRNVNNNSVSIKDEYTHLGFLVLTPEQVKMASTLDLSNLEGIRELETTLTPVDYYACVAYHLTNEQLGSSFDYSGMPEGRNLLWD